MGQCLDLNYHQPRGVVMGRRSGGRVEPHEGSSPLLDATERDEELGMQDAPVCTECAVLGLPASMAKHAPAHHEHQGSPSAAAGAGAKSTSGGAGVGPGMNINVNNVNNVNNNSNSNGGDRSTPSSSSSPCRHAARECYDCFMTPPFAQPRRTAACADLAEKRHGPMLHELFTLTTANGKRMCIVEDMGSGKGRASMLHVDDAERVMGFPAGWTEPCYPLKSHGRPTNRVGADADAALTKRVGLVGIAVAVPQARWIGERLMNPYGLKFSRAGDGVRFKVPVPGGPNASVGGAHVAALASSALSHPAAAENAFAASG